MGFDQRCGAGLGIVSEAPQGIHSLPNPETLQKIWNDTIENAYNEGALPRGFLKETFNDWFIDILENNGQKCLTLYPEFTKHIEQ